MPLGLVYEVGSGVGSPYGVPLIFGSSQICNSFGLGFQRSRVMMLWRLSSPRLHEGTGTQDMSYGQITPYIYPLHNPPVRSFDHGSSREMLMTMIMIKTMAATVTTTMTAALIVSMIVAMSMILAPVSPGSPQRRPFSGLAWARVQKLRNPGLGSIQGRCRAGRRFRVDRSRELT